MGARWHQNSGNNKSGKTKPAGAKARGTGTTVQGSKPAGEVAPQIRTTAPAITSGDRANPWSAPAGTKSAKGGTGRKAPATPLVRAYQSRLNDDPEYQAALGRMDRMGMQDTRIPGAWKTAVAKEEAANRRTRLRQDFGYSEAMRQLASRAAAEEPRTLSEELAPYSQLALDMSAQKTLSPETRKELRDTALFLSSDEAWARKGESEADRADRHALAHLLNSRASGKKIFGWGMTETIPGAKRIYRDAGAAALNRGGYAPEVADLMENTDFWQNAREADPRLYAAGKLAGMEITALTAGEIAQGIVGASAALRALPQTAKAAVTGGLQGGLESLSDALSQVPTKSQWDEKQREYAAYARQMGISYEPEPYDWVKQTKEVVANTSFGAFLGGLESIAGEQVKTAAFEALDALGMKNIPYQKAVETFLDLLMGQLFSEESEETWEELWHPGD